MTERLTTSGAFYLTLFQNSTSCQHKMAKKSIKSFPLIGGTDPLKSLIDEGFITLLYWDSGNMIETAVYNIDETFDDALAVATKVEGFITIGTVQYKFHDLKWAKVGIKVDSIKDADKYIIATRKEFKEYNEEFAKSFPEPAV
jgi:hypothetical protein